MRVLIYCLAPLTLAALAGSSAAHHSFAAEFSYELFGTREGEVVELHYVNPHTRVFVAVTNDDGEQEIWDAQTHSINILFRAGWLRETVKVGEHVVMEGNLGLENSRKLWIRSLRLEDGTVLEPDSGGAGARQQ